MLSLKKREEEKRLGSSGKIHLPVPTINGYCADKKSCVSIEACFAVVCSFLLL